MMNPFVDTSFFVAFINKGDNDHGRAQEIFVDIFHKRIDKPMINDYIIDETITTVRRRTKRHDDAVRALKLVTNSKLIDYVEVIQDDIDKALSEYERYRDKDLSFTDWVSVCFMKRRGIKSIIAFDTHFDQLGIHRLY